MPSDYPIDVDHVRIVPTDERANVRLSLAIDGADAEPGAVVLGSGARPWDPVETIELLDRALRWPLSLRQARREAEGRPFCRIHAVPKSEGGTAEIGEELDARLRALGYTN